MFNFPVRFNSQIRDDLIAKHEDSLKEQKTWISDVLKLVRKLVESAGSDIESIAQEQKTWISDVLKLIRKLAENAGSDMDIIANALDARMTRGL